MSTVVGSNVFPLGTDAHGIVAEGNYFTVNNAQTGIATASAPTSFSATNPFIVIYNKGVAGGPSIYLDFATLMPTAAGTNGTALLAAVTMDFGGNRYSSGGTVMTTSIVNPNGNSSNNASVAQVYAGNITASSATSQARTIVGQRVLKTAIPAVNDMYTIKFGGNEVITSSGPTAAVAFTTVGAPKLVIPPQGSALIHLWLPSQSAASSYAPELGWYER